MRKIGRDNIEFILGDFSDFDFSRVDICVVSPGVSLETPIMKAVKEHNIPIWGEVELAYRHDKGTVIGITGTNGKTTTTSLTYDIMKRHAKKLCSSATSRFPTPDTRSRATRTA